MSLDAYWERVRGFLQRHGGVENKCDHNRTRTGEHWELPVVAHGRAGKLLISFTPENSRAIYQCFDSGLGRHITMENGFKTNGVSYKGLVFSPFSYRINFLGSRDVDLIRWESFILDLVPKKSLAAAAAAAS